MTDESEATNATFRRSALNSIESADQLDHYIKVTNPSAWVVALAALILLVGIIVWAVVAVVPVNVNATGLIISEEEDSHCAVMCVVDKSTADKIDAKGAKATVNGVSSTNITVTHTPASSAEIRDFVKSEYYAEMLHLQDWNYLVFIELDEVPQHSEALVDSALGDAVLVPVSIVVLETQPINIVMGKN